MRNLRPGQVRPHSDLPMANGPMSWVHGPKSLEALKTEGIRAEVGLPMRSGPFLGVAYRSDYALPVIRIVLSHRNALQ
jgi:hypothetical protein